VIEKLIADPGPLFARVQELYRDGLRPGDPTGWDSLNRFYTVAPKQMTVVTGIPNMGKSEWLDALLVNLAIRDDWHFAIYSPENHPIELHISKLVEKFVGAPFGRGPTTRMDVECAKEASLWILERFIFLEPDYRDYASLLEAAVRYRCAGKKFGVVLDPWNALEHKRPSGMSETEYVSAALTYMTQWTRAADLHLWVVAHPSKIYKDANSGKRPVPTPYDIAGSAHWYNKSDCVIAVHRDLTAGNDLTEIHIQKVRFKHIGRIGAAELRYERVTGRYSDIPQTAVAVGRLPYADND
jgi:twinkle protein